MFVISSQEACMEIVSVVESGIGISKENIESYLELMYRLRVSVLIKKKQLVWGLFYAWLSLKEREQQSVLKVNLEKRLCSAFLSLNNQIKLK